MKQVIFKESLHFSFSNFPLKVFLTVLVLLLSVGGQSSGQDDANSALLTEIRNAALQTSQPDITAIQIPTEAVKIETTPSTVELLFSGQVPDADSAKLVQFGYSVFSRPASTFAPVTNAPVGPDYVVGPGDSFTVTLWGRFNAQYLVTVNRNGEIVLPEVGVMKVWGMTFSKLQEYLTSELSRKYQDFKMTITMNRLRTITVYIVGEAQTPGSYSLSSLSTVVNALLAAGGPSKNGSLRDIRVSRKDQQPLRIDLYKFLLGGDKSDDIRLQDGDTVFVPIIGPVVGVAGNVKRPAIYEMTKPMTLQDVLDLAGGVNYAGWLRQVQVARVENHQRRIVVDFNVAELAGVVGQQAANTIIKDGDMVKVFGVSPLEQGKRSASIAGEVYRPGEYRLIPGMMVHDLVNAAGGLQKNAYLKTAELTRRHVSQSGVQTEKIEINLEKTLTGDTKNNIVLEDYDHLIVRPIPELDFDRAATISGEVKFPGTYPIQRGEHLSSVIERAGGYTERAYLQGAVFTRDSVKVIQQQRMNQFIQQMETEVLGGAERTISGGLSAEEAKTQEQSLAAKKELLSKLRAARVEGRVVIHLNPLAKLKGSEYDLELERGDKLVIPEKPGVVNVIGEVYNPSALLYKENKTVSYYLRKVGGPTKEADKKYLSIIRADGSVASMSQKDYRDVSWDSENNLWLFGDFMNIRLNPGDTIVVPRELDRLEWLRNTKDITQVLFQIAVTAGVVVAIL